MFGLFIYQLGSADARKKLDLRDVALYSAILILLIQRLLRLVFVRIFIFSNFSSKSQMFKLQQLGKYNAGNLPVLCQEAMRHYFSVAHPPSNQLFKTVVGKKRIQEIMDELAAQLD